MISLDTETTGLDLYHDAKPFLVTTCNEVGEQETWEWDVDPLTRQPEYDLEDVREIEALVSSQELTFQNAKFDINAVSRIKGWTFRDWDWKNIHDTLLAAHLVDSDKPKDLTNLAVRYLERDISQHDKALKIACMKARTIAKRIYPDWKLASKGQAGMPSAKDTIWKFDMWILRAIAKAEGYPEDHPWWTLVSTYANADSAATMGVHLVLQKVIESKGLMKIYKERQKLLPVVIKMEDNGVTLNETRLHKLLDRYRIETEIAGDICCNIANSYGYDLVLPKSGNNKSLLNFVFKKEGLHLSVISVSKKTGEPSLDKEVITTYLETLPERSKALLFIRKLSEKRKRDTSIGYMEGYKKFWLPVNGGTFRLHPSLNSTGTKTLRWSSSNPNEQNISKKEGFNIRYAFGPSPDREWWSLDAKNIELRIPAYIANETEMIDLFERPNDPPYYGSNHLLTFDTLHPEKWDHDDPEGLLKAKKKYASTWYQRTKNGNFAVQYGAMPESGTADRAYGVEGGQLIVQKRFTKIKQLNQTMIEKANKTGHVSTLPDKNVDPTIGYPLYCTRTSYGAIKPTIPLNYCIQGTAMWWMMKAMLRCHEYLERYNRGRKRKYLMIMQVHDELVFDFPVPKMGDNSEVVNEIARLMEMGGEDLGFPTPVSIDQHKNNWSE